MEQDEDADPHPGRWPRGHLRLRADGTIAGAAGNDGPNLTPSSRPGDRVRRSSTSEGGSASRDDRSYRIKLTGHPERDRWPARQIRSTLGTFFDRYKFGNLHDPILGHRYSASRAAAARAVSRHHRRAENPAGRPGH